MRFTEQPTPLDEPPRLILTCHSLDIDGQTHFQTSTKPVPFHVLLLVVVGFLVAAFSPPTSARLDGSVGPGICRQYIEDAVPTPTWCTEALDGE